MGNNSNFCPSQCEKGNSRKKTNEITFLPEQIRPQGILNIQTIKYLSKTELQVFKAASSSNVLLLKLLLTSNNIGIFDSNRTSLLHVACRCGSLRVIQQLVHRNCQINLGDISGQTPMHIAASFKRQTVITKLTQLGGNPYIRDRKCKTIYELMDNQKIKRMMTEQLCQQDQAIDILNVKKSNILRDKYNELKGDRKDDRKISVQVQDNKDEILNHRQRYLKLNNQTPSTNYDNYQINKQNFKIILQENPKLGTLYFLNGRNRSAEIGLKILKQVKSKSFQFLANLNQQGGYQISKNILSLLFNKRILLPNLIKLLANTFDFKDKSPFQLHIFCYMISQLLCQDSLSKMQSICNMLFCLFLSNSSIIRNIYQQWQKQIYLNGQILNLSKFQIEQLKDFIKTSTTQVNTNYCYIETIMTGVFGKFIHAQQTIIFIEEDKIRLFEEMTNGQYNCIEIDSQNITKLQKRFKFNIIQ